MPIFVLVLIIINIAVFALPYIVRFGPTTSASVFNFLQLGWKSNSEIRDGEYYRLITSSFLHGDLFHLLINMYSLYQIGPGLLPLFGSIGFALIYFGSALGGSLASFFFNSNPSVGASGAIFGLIGAYLVMAILRRDPGLLANISIIILINLAIGFTPGSRIDNFGHLGGLAAGIVVTLGLVVLQGQGVRLR